MNSLTGEKESFRPLKDLLFCIACGRGGGGLARDIMRHLQPRTEWAESFRSLARGRQADIRQENKVIWYTCGPTAPGPHWNYMHDACAFGIYVCVCVDPNLSAMSRWRIRWRKVGCNPPPPPRKRQAIYQARSLAGHITYGFCRPVRRVIVES